MQLYLVLPVLLCLKLVTSTTPPNAGNCNTDADCRAPHRCVDYTYHPLMPPVPEGTIRRICAQSTFTPGHQEIQPAGEIRRPWATVSSGIKADSGSTGSMFSAGREPTINGGRISRPWSSGANRPPWLSSGQQSSNVANILWGTSPTEVTNTKNEQNSVTGLGPLEETGQVRRPWAFGTQASSELRGIRPLRPQPLGGGTILNPWENMRNPNSPWQAGSGGKPITFQPPVTDPNAWYLRNNGADGSFIKPWSTDQAQPQSPWQPRVIGGSNGQTPWRAATWRPSPMSPDPWTRTRVDLGDQEVSNVVRPWASNLEGTNEPEQPINAGSWPSALGGGTILNPWENMRNPNSPWQAGSSGKPLMLLPDTQRESGGEDSQTFPESQRLTCNRRTDCTRQMPQSSFNEEDPSSEPVCCHLPECNGVPPQQTCRPRNRCYSSCGISYILN